MQAAQVLTPNRYRYAQAATKVDQAKGKVVTYLILLILLAFTCCLFYIWSRIQIVNVGYEINRELGVKEKLIEENKRLSLEVATLKSPVRLEALAKNELHMDLPQKSQVLSDTQVKLLEVTPPEAAPKTAAQKVNSPPKGAALKTSSPKKQAATASEVKKAAPGSAPASLQKKETTAAKMSSEKKGLNAKGKDPSPSVRSTGKEPKTTAKVSSPPVKPAKVATTAGEHLHHR